MRHFTDIEGGTWRPFYIHISNENLIKLLEKARKKQKKDWKPTRDGLSIIF